MALPNALILSQITGHALILILATCMIVPLSFNEHYFCGHCLLFTTGEWREADGMFDPHWASSGFCHFPLATGILMVLISGIQCYRYIHMKEEESFLGLFIDVVLSIWMLAMSILSSIMITLGFIVWCDAMTERFETCEISAGQNIIHANNYQVDTSRFYVEMGTAQFGAWGAFAINVGIGVIALLKLINNHQVRNIKVNMYLERQRLVNQHQMNQDRCTTPPALASSDSEQGK